MQKTQWGHCNSTGKKKKFQEKLQKDKKMKQAKKKKTHK